MIVRWRTADDGKPVPGLAGGVRINLDHQLPDAEITPTTPPHLPHPHHNVKLGGWHYMALNTGQGYVFGFRPGTIPHSASPRQGSFGLKHRHMVSLLHVNCKLALVQGFERTHRVCGGCGIGWNVPE